MPLFGAFIKQPSCHISGGTRDPSSGRHWLEAVSLSMISKATDSQGSKGVFPRGGRDYSGQTQPTGQVRLDQKFDLTVQVVRSEDQIF